MSGELIGTVELDYGTARVAVSDDAEISIDFSTRFEEEGSTSVYLTTDEAVRLAELITKAVRLAPEISSARNDCRRRVTAAEAEYEGFVADLIGGSE
ncbi:MULTISPECIES: hypothetical protein [Mycolicibacterium]|uniref:Uncharacterized protein n=2 Tax=Mycolicibacterium TaxID=1866885 RepID=A0AAE4VCZ9_MYCFO|nr:hypothetical protein [Mycolicibacterium fortuitum]MDV7192558.1 hypothetical protein [Mycolicibacterium fortuitum]MDV7205459.1 hypothetical protein [Mycolicibacterium fortuitum]MDV7227040.1 hypothetical protein [Mycolicibacterium fortuitum]MDV7259715.1 hypothetical protein [Mycolicibacterium fortuitum]MDV7286278.1 hypothetical protein [Mycolicibacterium fortuitum]